MFAIQKNGEGKRVSYSSIEDQRINLFDEHVSPHGFVFGSRLLEIVDEYTKLVAQKHTEMKCVISSINYVRFFSQAKRDDILICKASVNKTWETSLEVGVKVIAEDFRSLEKKHILSAYFTFDVTDENGALVNVPEIIYETEDQKRRYLESQIRKTKSHKYLNISHLNK
jgi:acyl-CoA hydrolase